MKQKEIEMTIEMVRFLVNVFTVFFGYMFIRNVINSLDGMKPIIPFDKDDDRSDYELSAFQRLRGNMVFSNMSFIGLIVCSGVAAYLQQPDRILFWGVEIVGSVFLLNWFIRTILMRDGIIDSIAIIIGVVCLYIASDSLFYTGFVALFIVAITTIRLSIWWYTGGREIASDRVQKVEISSFLSRVFAWLIITTWRLKK